MIAGFFLWFLVLASFRRQLSQFASSQDRNRVSLFALFLSFCFSFFGNFESLFLVSDAAEYLHGALQLSSGADYSFTLEGVERPYRYPLWTSSFFAPILYVFAQFAPLQGEFFSLAVQTSLFLVLFFLFFQSCSLLHVRSLEALSLFLFVLLLTPELRYFLSLPLSELLILLFMLNSWALLRDGEGSFELLLLGSQLALICLVRPTLSPLAVMICALQLRRSLLSLLLFAAPSALLLLLTLKSNFETFAAYFRTGYHYWVPLPYECFSSTFAFKYFLPHIEQAFTGSSLPAFCLLFCFLLTRPAVGRSFLKQKDLVVLAASLALYCFFQFSYFYYSPRFLLPLFLFLLVSSFNLSFESLEDLWLKLGQRRFLVSSFVILFLLAGLAVGLSKGSSSDLYSRLRDLSPGLVVSDEHPLKQALWFGQDSPELWAASREAEYASKLVASKPLLSSSELCALDPFDHRNELLKQLGAEESREQVLENTSRDSFQAALERSAERPAVFLANEISSQEAQRFKELGLHLKTLSGGDISTIHAH